MEQVQKYNQSWIQFYHSNFKYWPPKKFDIEKTKSFSGSGVVAYKLNFIWKTNKAKWAKQ